jgi:hypothetical protein
LSSKDLGLRYGERENAERGVREPAFGWPAKADARAVLRDALGNTAREEQVDTLSERPPAERFYDSEEQWDAVLKWHLQRP